MKYNFEPGEKIRPKGSDGLDYYFIGQVGDTVYTTVTHPEFAVGAKAHTDRDWERVPKPFFKEKVEYRHPGYSLRYTIHHVFEMGGKRYAAALNIYGDESFWNEDDFGEMVEA